MIGSVIQSFNNILICQVALDSANRYNWS